MEVYFMIWTRKILNFLLFYLVIFTIINLFYKYSASVSTEFDRDSKFERPNR